MVTALVTALFLPSDLRASDETCREAVSTAEMLTCAAGLYQQADAELNRVYRQLAAQLSGPRKAQLKTSQQAWLVFRDKNAAFAAGVAEGGSMASLVEVTELTGMTRSRTEQLRAYLKERP
jgi:uncharacterized protein YecT (DUF1311 family)